MQWSDSFTKRLLFGASKAYVQQMDKGEEYNSLCPVYGVGIINDTFDKQSEDWFHHYRSVNIEKPERVLEGLELIFIELPKFKPQSWKDKKLGVLWLRFLKETNEHLTDVPEEFTQIPELTKAMELAQESAYSKAELEVYDKYWDEVSIQKTFFHDGVEKGKIEGREEGAQAMQKEIAKKMLSQGLAIEMVVEVTNLTPAEIRNLK